MLFVCSVAWLFLLGCQYQCKWLTGKTRLQIFNVLMGTLNPTHSLTHSLSIVVTVEKAGLEMVDIIAGLEKEQ